MSILLTCSLGVWQVKRLAWKQELIQTLQNNLNYPPTPLETLDLEAHTLEGRLVYTEGIPIESASYHLMNHYQKQTLGYRHLSLIKTKQGQLIFVLKPWSKEKSLEQPLSFIRVQGILRKSQKPRNLIGLHNNLKEKELIFIDLDELSVDTSRNITKLYYIESLEGETPLDLKRKFFEKLNLRNHHMLYAITWFTLSIALLLYLIHFLRRMKKQ